MWIRSQDKDLLIECNLFKIEKDGMDGLCYLYGNLTGSNYINKGNLIILGIFDDKKNAMKVLDKIEHLLSADIAMNKIVFGIPTQNELDDLE